MMFNAFTCSCFFIGFHTGNVNMEYTCVLRCFYFYIFICSPPPTLDAPPQSDLCRQFWPTQGICTDSHLEKLGSRQALARLPLAEKRRRLVHIKGHI